MIVEEAIILPLQVMDEHGNTHMLQALRAQPDGTRPNLRSHGGRCVRLTKGVNVQIGAMLGPPLGVCPALDHADMCGAGPVRGCPSSYWSASRYVSTPPTSTAFEKPYGFDGIIGQALHGGLAP